MADINFPGFALVIGLFWLVGLLFFLRSILVKKSPKIALVALWSGLGVLALFIGLLWIKIERPPMRTLGETRLWYAFFLPLIGFVVYHSRKYSWMIFYSIGLAALFLSLNFFKPELFNKALMPALQSVWFVPHVIVYMLSYALLAASSLVALRGLWSRTKSAKIQEIIRLADDLVYLGFGFLSLGLIFGALWAKEAWGHYWTWDPKETWAFLTWICYLGYIHFRYYAPKNTRVQLWILAFAFVVLLMCWFGINYLPSAANSVHTYGQ